MSNWTRTDFMAYLMLFAANSDLKVTEEEMELTKAASMQTLLNLYKRK